MNIQSTMKGRRAFLQRDGAQPPTDKQEQPPQDKVSFAGGVAQGGSFSAGLAGPVAGLRWGFKAGMELSIALGQYEVGLASLGGALVGGVAGYFVGRHAPHMAGKLTEKLGMSEQAGQAVGSLAVGAALGGAAVGPYGAGAAATIALGTGAVQHLRG